MRLEKDGRVWYGVLCACGGLMSYGAAECRRCSNRKKGSIPKKRRPAEARFWRYVEETSGCWLWTGGKNSKGYGQFALCRGQTLRAHRYAYAIRVGAIPEGLTLDHLCRNRACVNPAHLEPVTIRENLRRGLVARQLQGLGPESLRKGRPVGQAELAL